MLQVTYEKSDATQRSWWSFSILAPDRYCGLLPHRSWGQRQVLVAALPRCLSSQKTESRWPSQLGLKFCQSGCAARKLPTGARCARSRGARIEKSKFSFLGPQLYPDFRFESNWVRFQIWSHVNYSNRKRFWETTAECWLNDSLKRMPFSCLAGTMSGKHKSFYLICAASSLIALLDAKGWSGCKYLQLILFHPFSSVWQQKSKDSQLLLALKDLRWEINSSRWNLHVKSRWQMFLRTLYCDILTWHVISRRAFFQRWTLTMNFVCILHVDVCWSLIVLCSFFSFKLRMVK